MVISYKKIGLLAKLESKESQAQAKQCLRLLSQLTDSKLLEGKSLEKNLQDCELLLTLGGDGTLLRGARLLLETGAWKSCRLAGINTGRLGFLANLGPGIKSRQLRALLSSKASLFARRTCLQVRSGRKQFHVLNDAVLTKGTISRLFELSVFVSGQLFSTYRADGLIVSTPTGSTAYALAAGGSIIEPSVPAIQLTPICPQSFSNKPIVISDSNQVLIKLVRSSSQIFLTLDGQTSMKIGAQQRIEISRSEKFISLYQGGESHQASYIHSLRHKLKWGLA